VAPGAELWVADLQRKRTTVERYDLTRPE